MNIIAIANQKGGVGKTTTTVNIATALAAIGKKTLLIDLDPQGNAGTGMGLLDRNKLKGTYHLLIEGAPLHECLHPTKIPGLSLIPASRDLSGAEVELVTMEKREYRLSLSLTANDDFDYVLLDCPPSLGFLTVNALTASSHVIIPLQCEFYALEGLSQLVNTIRRIQQRLNPSLSLMGIVLTMHDKRNALNEQVAQDVKHHFKDKVFSTVIPRNIRISEAPSHGMPVLIYDVKSAGSLAYMKLASEIIKKDGVAPHVKLAS